MSATIERGAFSLFLSHFIFFATGYLIYFFLGRILLESNFGVYSVVISLVSVISMVLMTAIEQTVSKFVSENEKSHDAVKKTALLLHLGISSLAFVAFVLLAPFIALLLNDASLTPLIRMIAPLIIVHPLFSLFTGALNGLKRFSLQAKLVAAYSFAKMFLIVGLVSLGFGLVGAIGGFILSSILIVVVSALAVGINLKSSTASSATMLGFAMPIGGLAVITNILTSLDLFAVKALTEAETASALAGYYTAAGTIAKIIPTMVLALSVVLFPLVSSATFSRNHEKTKFYINNALRYSVLFIAPLATIFFAGPGEIIGLVYGSRYLLGAVPLQILAIALSIFAIFSVLITIISASGSPKASLLISAFVLAAAVALNIVLVPAFGMKGAATATLFSSCLGLLAAAVFVGIKFKALLSAKSVARIALASLAVFAAAQFLSFSGPMLVFKYFILLILYLAALLVLRELRYFDLQVLTNVLRK